MKRFAFTFVALSFSTGVLAAYPASNDSSLITIPQLAGGFFVGATGIYLQPTDTQGDLDYVSINTNAASVAAGFASPFASEVRNIDPGFNWGWGLNAGYLFPNTGNDINVVFLRLDSDDTDTMSSFPFSMSPLNYSQDSSFFNTFSSAYAKVSYDIDQLDLLVGQYVDIGCRLRVHPNVGLRWAEIDRTITSYYTQPLVLINPALPPNITNFTEKSDFSGIGPIAGMDASYYLGDGVGVVAHLDSGILIGDREAKTNVALNSTEFGQFGPSSFQAAFAFKSDDTRLLVPFVDAKLGVDYTYVFNNAANSDVTLEAGYQVSQDYHVVDQLVPNANLLANRGTVLSQKTSDLGLNGPYASLVFHI